MRHRYIYAVSIDVEADTLDAAATLAEAKIESVTDDYSLLTYASLSDHIPDTYVSRLNEE